MIIYLAGSAGILPCEYIDLKATEFKEASHIKKAGDKYEWHGVEAGVFQLSTASWVKLQVAEIWKNAGHITVFDGNGRAIWKMPSVFTGSFKLDGGCENGLYVRQGGGANATITWQEYNEQT